MCGFYWATLYMYMRPLNRSKERATKVHYVHFPRLWFGPSFSTSCIFLFKGVFRGLSPDTRTPFGGETFLVLIFNAKKFYAKFWIFLKMHTWNVPRPFPVSKHAVHCSCSCISIFQSPRPRSTVGSAETCLFSYWTSATVCYTFLCSRLFFWTRHCRLHGTHDHRGLGATPRVAYNRYRPTHMTTPHVICLENGFPTPVATNGVANVNVCIDWPILYWPTQSHCIV